jgi:uncharacterized protein YbaP (TraB family)
MRSFLTGLAALALAACGSTTSAAPARPALWKLSDPDTTIYLFGTVHVLPKGLDWRTEMFDAALASADEIVLEIADTGDRAASAKTFQGLASSPGLPPILDRVSPAKRAGLAALIEKAGLKPAQLDPLESWAAAVTLGATLYAGAGLTADNGVEKAVSGAAQSAAKPTIGLETTAQQLGYFDALPEKAQRELLESVVDDSKDVTAEFDKMVSAWRRGDVKAIAATFDDELRKSPELAAILLDRRNANWTEWLKARLDKPGTAFVAVGAGHLAGKGSVVDRLRAAGLKVERVQ